MNPDFIEKYIEEYGRDVYSFCVYITRNTKDADDLYQQTFLVAIDKGELDDNKNPKSYLISVAANIWNNHKRKYMWRKKKANIVYLENDDVEQLAENEETIEEKLIRRDEEELVRALVNRLPDKLRIVIIMYYMEDMAVDEIARALAIPSGTVKSRLHQAKNKLKERLMNYER